MVATTVEDDLRVLSPETFASKYVMESVPHVFAGDMDVYIDWKSELGSLIEVDPRAIAITGSAGVGISLNPYNARSAFHGESDVDVAVVSSHHFEVAWRHMRSMSGTQRLQLKRRQVESLNDHRSRLIYWGAIATDRILELFPFAATWVVALSHMAGIDPTAGRDINARIYRDFDSLRAYQLQGIRQARDDLLSSKGTSP